MEGNASRKSVSSLLMSRGARRRQRVAADLGQLFLLAVTSLSTLAVLAIFYFIARDAIPFFRLEGFKEFFTSTRWYPSAAEPEFGALAIFAGSGLVTLGAALVAVPLGIAAAVCLSDVLPFAARQVAKPVVEMLAAIPSVAYGFFALVVLAPLMQRSGGPVLAAATWIIGAPVAALLAFILADLGADRFPAHVQKTARRGLLLVLGLAAVAGYGRRPGRWPDCRLPAAPTP